MSKRKPYVDRTDLEKVQSQWNKLTGLHSRDESSAAIVRAATAAELAANFAVRKEFESKSKLSKEFVDSLLVWANGISGKVDRLLIPITKGEKYHKVVTKLKDVSVKINKKRNSVAHQGEFCNPEESDVVIQQAKEFIETLVKIYEPNFELKNKKC
ncbi:MAG: hypothetical protein GC149_09950 [Gammaproteobacteria bacterium]|nr:hypothetical protein [Gammaproteobacteria bacterium]